MTNWNNQGIRNRRRGSRISLATALMVFAVIIIVGLAILARPYASQLFYFVSGPVLQLRNSFGATEVATLKAKLAEADAALADRDILVAENNDLKARLGRDASGSRILAGVLLRPPNSAFDTFIIDIGSDKGVKVGTLVFAGGNTGLGEVSEVDPHTSRVTLYSTSGVEHQALLMLNGGNGRALPVSVAGQGSGAFVTQVPAGTAVAVGDPVVFAGVGGGLVAKVAGVTADPAQSFMNVYLHLPVNLFELRYVEVEHK